MNAGLTRNCEIDDQYKSVLLENSDTDRSDIKDSFGINFITAVLD